MTDGCVAGRTLLGFLLYVPLQRWMTIGLQVETRSLLSAKHVHGQTAGCLQGAGQTSGMQGTCIESGSAMGCIKT